MSVALWIWFSVVAVFFSSASWRRVMLDRQLLLDRVIAVALIGRGVTVVVSSGRWGAGLPGRLIAH